MSKFITFIAAALFFVGVASAAQAQEQTDSNHCLYGSDCAAVATVDVGAPTVNNIIDNTVSTVIFPEVQVKPELPATAVAPAADEGIVIGTVTCAGNGSVFIAGEKIC